MKSASKIPVLDLAPKGRYADGTPWYSFHNPFSASTPRALSVCFDTPEKAYDEGRAHVATYEKHFFPGGMGAVLGVVQGEDGYRAVIVTYYSNS